MPDRDPLLVEREKIHGSFEVNATIAQRIKDTYTIGKYRVLDSRQREALDLIATKIGRILSGDHNHKDHWDDIAGYAHLGAEACPKTD